MLVFQTFLKTLFFILVMKKLQLSTSVTVWFCVSCLPVVHKLALSGSSHRQVLIREDGDEPSLSLNSIGFSIPLYKSNPSDLNSRCMLFQEIQDLVNRLALHDMHKLFYDFPLHGEDWLQITQYGQKWEKTLIKQKGKFACIN